MATPHDATSHLNTTTPGGELGGTWASPTVDATHSGSAHHGEDHDHDGTPTQKLLAANSHESPSADTHHADVHGNAKHSDPEADFNRLKSGLWYPVTGFAASTTPVLDQLRLAPFPVAKTVTLDRLGLWVQAGVALSVVRLGIYRDDGDGYPGALVLDAGTIDASSQGFKTITISQQLTRDLYWIGGVGQTIVTAMTIAATNVPTWDQTGQHLTPSSQALVYVGFLQAAVSGALPANFTTTKESSFNAPRVHVRIA